MRKPKAIKREYVDDDGDGDSDFNPGESSREKKGELTMQITKKAKKKVKKEPTTGDDDEGGSKPTSQKIGFDITTGPVQDEGLQAKYNAMSLDELKQYMKVRF